MTDRIAFASTATVEGRNIRGSVTLKGARTFRAGEWVEVDPAALVKAEAVNVFGRFNHDPSQVLARTTNGTLTFTRTEDGFDYLMRDIPNTQAGNDALELAKGGYLNGSSFEIEGPRSEFSTDPDGTRVRRITSIKRLVDISPVFDPAFSSSSVAAFSKESEDMTDTAEPKAPEPKAEAFAAPVITPAPAPKDERSDVYRTAEKFARDRGTLAELASAMDNLLAQPRSKANTEAYKAMAAVYDERARGDESDTDSLAAFKLAQDLRMGRGPKAPANAEQFASEDYKQAFNAYLRATPSTIGQATTRMESFAQTITGDGTQGGFTVPDGFIARLTERLKAYGGIASAAEEIVTSTGESLRWTYIDDTANEAVIAAEDTQAASGADLAFDGIELGAFEYDATGASGNPIEVSLPLIQDSAFDIEALLTRLLSKRIGRKQARDFANGIGGSQPVGLLSKTLDTMTATVTSLAAVEHMLQVDAEYRDGGNTSWVMSDTSLAKVWGAQSTTNQPLFLPGGMTINGKPFDTLYGRPIRNEPAAGDKVAFGDIEAGYIIRRVRGVQLLVDPYTAQKRRAVQYHAWARADANIQDPNAYSVSTWASVTADT